MLSSISTHIDIDLALHNATGSLPNTPLSPLFRRWIVATQLPSQYGRCHLPDSTRTISNRTQSGIFSMRSALILSARSPESLPLATAESKLSS
jgi:hypothetical protein